MLLSGGRPDSFLNPSSTVYPRPLWASALLACNITWSNFHAMEVLRDAATGRYGNDRH